MDALLPIKVVELAFPALSKCCINLFVLILCIKSLNLQFSKQVFIRNLSTILARWNGRIALGVLSKGYTNFFDPCRRGRSTSYQGG